VVLRAARALVAALHPAPAYVAAGTSGVHLAAYFGTLKTIKDGVTAEQMIETRDCNGGSALRVAAFRGHIDQIKGGVTEEHLLKDPTTEVCLISPNDWGDRNTSVDMTTMRFLERAIEASHPNIESPAPRSSGVVIIGRRSRSVVGISVRFRDRSQNRGLMMGSEF
jgi:hypothetical protein